MSTAASPEETPVKPKPKATLVLPLILVVALLGLLFAALRSGDPASLPSVLIGKPVPEFELAGIPRLTSETGAPVPGLSSAALKSGKVSLLNVWASWCAPCLSEHPQLQELSKQGIPLYAINYKGDTTEGARRFLLRNGNPFLAIGMDDKGTTAIDFGVYGVPETFVIDGAGRIAYRYAGPITPEILAAKIMPAIRKAEKDGAGAPS